MQKPRGNFVSRPPCFDGSNYAHWKARMEIFLNSMDWAIWDIIEMGWTTPVEEVVVNGVKTTMPLPYATEGPKNFRSANGKHLMPSPVLSHLINSNEL